MIFAVTLPPSEQPLFKIADTIPVPGLVVTEWVIILLIGIVAYLATRRMQRVPSGLQNALEYVIQVTTDFFGGMMSESAAKKWTPLLCTFFLFILVSNYSGLLPGAGNMPGFKPPTSDWNVTGTLAVIVFFAVQVAGFREHKAGYLKHFVQPYVPFLPLNLLEELAHPLSLTLRLFGNIFGEEMIVSFISMMAPFLIPMVMMALGMLTGFIQAMVFAVLAATYIGTAASEGH